MQNPALQDRMKMYAKLVNNNDIYAVCVQAGTYPQPEAQASAIRYTQTMRKRNSTMPRAEQNAEEVFARKNQEVSRLPGAPQVTARIQELAYYALGQPPAAELEKLRTMCRPILGEFDATVV